MTDYIYLNSLRMNHFTIQDALLYCQIFNINPDDITILDLDDNNLTDISGVSIFKNLETLYLYNNDIKDLNPLKDLINLKVLSIGYLSLTDESDTVEILKTLTNLNELRCKNTFKTVDIKNELKGLRLKILHS